MTDSEQRQFSDRESHFRILCAAALVDGKVHAKEQELLHKLAERLQISQSEADAVLKELDEKGEEDLEFPEDPEVQNTLFMDIIAMIAVDGTLTVDEMELLGQVGQAMGKSEDDVKGSVEAYLKRE